MPLEEALYDNSNLKQDAFDHGAKAHKQSPFEEAFEDYNRADEQLSKAIAVLIERLAPVSRPGEEVERDMIATNRKEGQGNSHYAIALQANADSVRQHTRRIQSLVANLEV